MSSQNIATGRLTAAEYTAAFDQDSKTPLDSRTAKVEASRCYFCYDAPCVEACPTAIDIPSFIRKIFTGNIDGAAMDILEPNIFGGACARVCPVEELCEEACVRTTQESKPVVIGMLQRFATDKFFEHGKQPFRRKLDTGKKIAIVGAGPAGLACAHALSRKGHVVKVFEEKTKPGGLNEYGIAAYKVPDNFAQKEIEFILGIGGIIIDYGKALGQELNLTSLSKENDAVFLAIGQTGIRNLKIEGEDLTGVEAAASYISTLRQTPDKSLLPVGQRVLVIGGGNTAIDIATQVKRLGSEDVTIVYRKGPENMTATRQEQEFAQKNGVRIKYWGTPTRFLGTDGCVTGAEFAYTNRTGDDTATYVLPADQIFRAVGQSVDVDPISNELEISDGRIIVNENLETSVRGIFAGGDCIPGLDLTVQAVQDGKVAALAIDQYIQNSL